MTINKIAYLTTLKLDGLTLDESIKYLTDLKTEYETLYKDLHIYWYDEDDGGFYLQGVRPETEYEYKRRIFLQERAEADLELRKSEEEREERELYNKLREKYEQLD